MNYGELKDTVRGYTHRKDIDVQIVFAISLAENRIYRDCRTAENEFWKAVDVTESPFALPGEWVAAREITVGGVNGKRQALDYYNPAQFSRTSYVAGNGPIAYTINQRAMSLAPAPSVEAPAALQLGYWGKLNPLTNDSDENAMLNAYPGLFVYGAMLEIAPYTMNGEAYDVWKKAYMEQVMEVNKASERGRLGVDLAMRAS